VLRVQAAWREPDADSATTESLAGELRRMAAWLGLSDVAVAERGDLAAELAESLGGD
jgi:uncharacterized protein YcaQ